MRLDFSAMEQTVIPHFMGGEKSVSAAMWVDALGKIMRGTLEPGASIGMHRHETSSEIVYILSGCGTATCDGVDEALSSGVCHYCPKGSTHSIVNDGAEPLEFFAVVPNQ